MVIVVLSLTEAIKVECENQGDDYYWINCYRKNYKGVSNEIN